MNTASTMAMKALQTAATQCNSAPRQDLRRVRGLCWDVLGFCEATGGGCAHACLAALFSVGDTKLPTH